MQINTSCDYLATFPNLIDLGEDYMLLECLPYPQYLELSPEPICIRFHEGAVEDANIDNLTLVCKTPHFLRAYFGGMPMFEIKTQNNSIISLYKGDNNDFVAALPKGATFTTHWG